MTARSLERLRELAALGAQACEFDVAEPARVREVVPPGATVLHSVPALVGEQGPFEATPAIVEAMKNRPRRVVYLSTTGVYGSTEEVDETTAINPNTPRALLRALAESAVEAGPWESLILRPAAIYGPGRGVHVAMPAARYRLLGDGSNYVSRIHVDDLAAISAAALGSALQGAYPVADAHPSTSAEIAEWVGTLLGVPVIRGERPESLSETRRSNRRVDGSAVLRELGVGLKYPSYREGIPASLT